MGIKKSIYYVAIGQYGTQLITFALTLLLARILEPKDFGLLSMIAIFVGLSSTIINIGYDSAIIRYREIDSPSLLAILYLNITVSLMVYLVLYLSSGTIADFYDVPILRSLSRVLFIGIIFDASSKVPMALLMRELRYKELARIRIISAVAAGVVGLVAAITGYGVWSLVVQQLVATSLSSIMMFATVRVSFTAGVNWSAVSKYYTFSKHIFYTGLFSRVFYNLDSLIIGKLLGSVELGYYSRAMAVRDYPVKNAITVIEKVLFPHFSAEIGSKQEAPTRSLEKIFGMMVMTTLWAGLMFTIYSNEIVIGLLSAKWAYCVPYFYTMALFTPVKPLGAIISSGVLAYDSPRKLWSMELYEKSGMVLGLLGVTIWGVIGFIIFYGFGGLMAVVYGLRVLSKHSSFDGLLVKSSIRSHGIITISLFAMASVAKWYLISETIGLLLVGLAVLVLGHVYYKVTGDRDYRRATDGLLVIKAKILGVLHR